LRLDLESRTESRWRRVSAGRAGWRTARVFASEAYVGAIGGGAAGTGPGSCAVDGFAILLKPTTEGLQPAQLDGRDSSVGLWSNIEKQIAILTDDIHQKINQILGGDSFGFAFGAVETEGTAQPATFFPLYGPDFV
jgi:hypothetical protein